MVVMVNRKQREGALRKRAVEFNSALDNPGVWLVEALRLERAARKIKPKFPNHANPDADQQNEIDLFEPPYRLLMGLAIENLIKGIIIAHGQSLGGSGKLDEKFRNHRYNALLNQINKARFPISGAERKVLDSLEAYVLWAGRYPIPKKKGGRDWLAERYDSKTQSDESLLFDRLKAHLRATGWTLVMGLKKPL